MDTSTTSRRLLAGHYEKTLRIYRQGHSFGSPGEGALKASKMSDDMLWKELEAEVGTFMVDPDAGQIQEQGESESWGNYSYMPTSITELANNRSYTPLSRFFISAEGPWAHPPSPVLVSSSTDVKAVPQLDKHVAAVSAPPKKAAEKDAKMVDEEKKAEKKEADSKGEKLMAALATANEKKKIEKEAVEQQVRDEDEEYTARLAAMKESSDKRVAEELAEKLAKEAYPEEQKNKDGAKKPN